MDKNLEKAIKRGVPTYETCVELDWKLPTISYWAKSDEGELMIIDESAKRIVEALRATKNINTELIPAPTMHEITKELPEFIEVLWDYSDNMFSNHEKRNLFFTAMKKSVSYYSEYYNLKLYEVMIENNHFAEAYAKLQIQLTNNDNKWKSSAS